MTKTEQIRELLKQGKPPKEIAKKVGASLPYVYTVKNKKVSSRRRRKSANNLSEVLGFKSVTLQCSKCHKELTIRVNKKEVWDEFLKQHSRDYVCLNCRSKRH